MPYCIPACKGCRESGICPKGEIPDSAYAPEPRRKPPRRAAVKATYPRDVNPGYELLTCGHYTCKQDVMFYSVWAPKDKHKRYCTTCGRWVRLRKIPADSPNPIDIPTLF